MSRGDTELATAITKLIMDHYTKDEVTMVDLGEMAMALAWVAGFFMAGVSPKSFKVGLSGMAREMRKCRIECQREGVTMPAVVVEDSDVSH